MLFTEQFGNHACFDDSISCSVDGFDATAQIKVDDNAEPPWDREDGHGPVSDWTTRAKTPGERVLCEDRGHKRYYDTQEATLLARRDGWDTPPYGKGTAGEQAARAVEADYNALRLWCADEWHYCGIVVTVTREGVTLGIASLWGIDLNHPNGNNEYLAEVANELLPEAMEEAKRTVDKLCVTH